MTASLPPDVMQTARDAVRRFHSMEMGIEECIADAIMRDREQRLRQIAGQTKCQRDAFAFIKSYFIERGITPTYDEIAKGLGLRSKSGIHRIVVGLEERGLIVRLPYRARSIAIVERST